MHRPVLSANDFQAATAHAKPYVNVWSDAAQTFTTGVSALITFNQEAYDRWNMHDNSTNNDRLTVKVAGIYILVLSVQWGGVAAAGTRRLIRVFHNFQSGATANTLSTHSAISDSAGNPTLFTMTCMSEPAEPGDYFNALGRQDSGGNLDLTAATATNWQRQAFHAIWITRG